MKRGDLPLAAPRQLMFMGQIPQSSQSDLGTTPREKAHGQA
jgi:hypothetical protein